MAVSRISVGTAVANTTTTITPAYPTGVSAGRVALIFVETGNSVPTAPTGYTQIVSAGVGSGGTDVSATRLLVYRRVLDGSESGTVTVNRGATHVQAVIAIYDGVDNTTPETVSTTKAGTPATTAGSTNSVASAGGDGGAMFLACYATDRDSASAATISSSAFANIAGTPGNLVNVSSAISGGGGIIVEELDPTGNSTGAISHSVTFDSTLWASQLIKLNPFAGAYTLTAANGP